MNILLFEQREVVGGVLQLVDRRAIHVIEQWRAAVGDSVRVGEINGKVGSAEVIGIDGSAVTLRPKLTANPPAGLKTTMVLAMPRPKVWRRLLKRITAIGLKEIFLIKTWRVDKSYWMSPALQPASLKHDMQLGLEQAGDTLLPQVHIRQLFKPFVEDELPQLLAGRSGVVFHPAAAKAAPAVLQQDSVLFIGPERGFISYELQSLAALGIAEYSLGKRLLDVEAVTPFVLGRVAVD